MIRRARGFAAFWWDFVVGDDWRVAAGVVAALGLTALLEALDITAWWLTPVGALGLLSLSAWRKASS
jgi:hypothetical protein